jgi:hypothetical protein
MESARENTERVAGRHDGGVRFQQGVTGTIPENGGDVMITWKSVPTPEGTIWTSERFTILGPLHEFGTAVLIDHEAETETTHETLGTAKAAAERLLAGEDADVPVVLVAQG